MIIRFVGRTRNVVVKFLIAPCCDVILTLTPCVPGGVDSGSFENNKCRVIV